MGSNQIIFFLYENSELKKKLLVIFFFNSWDAKKHFPLKNTSVNFQRDLKSICLLLLIVD